MRLSLLSLLVGLASSATAEGLSDAALQRLRSDPAPFLGLAAQVIATQGEAGVIGPDGITRFVALERAMALALALRLHMADGDLDGQVTQAEMAVRLQKLAQAANSRMWGQFRAADGNGDGVLSAQELSAFGQARAEAAFSDTDEAMLRAVLGFDADGDGRVSLDEVQAGVSALGT